MSSPQSQLPSFWATVALCFVVGGFMELVAGGSLGGAVGNPVAIAITAAAVLVAHVFRVVVTKLLVATDRRRIVGYAGAALIAAGFFGITIFSAPSPRPQRVPSQAMPLEEGPQAPGGRGGAPRQRTCTICSGSGRRACDTCGGKGYVQRTIYTKNADVLRTHC